MGLISKRTQKPVSKTQAFRFFREIFYAGLFDFKSERYKGSHKPMITMSEYNRVQSIINRRNRDHKHRNDYFFMRTLRCGECGCSITAERHTKKSGLVFVYGRCTKKRRKNGVMCGQPYVNANELEKQTIAFIKSIEISPQLVEWVREELRLRNEKEFEFEKTQKVKQTKKLQVLLDQKKQLYGMKIDGLIDEEEYKKEKKRLLNLEQQIKGYLKTDNTFHWEKTLEDILDFSVNAALIFKKADPEARRKILRILGSNLFLKDKKVLIDGKKAFIILKNADKSLNRKMDRLEPQERPILQINQPSSSKKFHLERDTVLGSNLSKYITPDLGIQLLALKEHMGVDSFAFA